MSIMALGLDALEALPVPRSKSELLGRIRPARQALEDLAASLEEGALNRVDHAGWRVRDHLSHISAWERMLIAHVTDDSDHTVAQLPREGFTSLPLQDINDRLHELHRDDDLSDVIAEFAASHKEIGALIADLSDEDLAQPYWDDDPQQRTAIEKVAGDTYQHYLEHRRWIAVLAEGAEAQA
jgi:hypothetical protein